MSFNAIQESVLDGGLWRSTNFQISAACLIRIGLMAKPLSGAWRTGYLLVRRGGINLPIMNSSPNGMSVAVAVVSLDVNISKRKMNVGNVLIKKERKAMSNLPVIRKEMMSERVVAEIQDALPTAIGKHAKEMAMRYVKMGYAVISQNPTLQQCTIKSLVRSMSQSASLDLEIDQRGLAYLVPYKNKGVMEAQLQIGYQGLMELAYRSAKVKSISAHCIYASEKDNVVIKRVDGRFHVEHPFSYEQPSGEMIAVYATAEVDGVLPQTIVLRKKEVEKFRTMSKGPNSPAWSGHYEAMAKKTAIRQLAKFLPKSVAEELTRGAAMDEQEDFVTAQANASRMIEEASGSEVVDSVFEENGEQNETNEPEQTETPDPETQAKIDKQKADLAAADKKKPGRKPNKGKEVIPSKYTCNGCKQGFDVAKVLDGGELQCPRCFSVKVTVNEPEAEGAPEWKEGD